MNSSQTAAEVGISPVLLQAITQTLSTNAVKQEKHSAPDMPEPQQVIVSYEPEGPVSSKMHLLQGLGEPAGAGETIVVIQNVDGNGQPHSSQQILIKPTGQPGGGGGGTNMGSMLTAIATHLKNSRKRNEGRVSPPPGMMVEEAAPTEMPPAGKRARGEGGERMQEATTFVVNAEGLPEGTLLQAIQTEHGITVTQIEKSDGQQQEVVYGPCPICGDRISGYHYGIYTCESCKGFFKRTVQNKKAFICHRKGECDVNLMSRKKCPACRFRRCIMAGMKLEGKCTLPSAGDFSHFYIMMTKRNGNWLHTIPAIRGDRMRGGRSSYDGCSPQGPRVKSTGTPPVVRVNKTNILPRKLAQDLTGAPAQPVEVLPKASGPSQTIMVSMGSGNELEVEVPLEVMRTEEVVRTEETEVVPGPTPHVPQPLEDLINLESLMMEDEGEQACCEGKMRDGDPDPFGSLVHVADHCLYKIVRWARNLPDFAAISTDDQILLLQNCWADLLCLSVCWASVQGDGETLLLSHGRTLNIELAKVIGLAEVTQRQLDFTQQLQRIQIDMHEFIALKAIILMTPDVKGLKQVDVIRDYQDKIAESLLIYSITHYPANPNKHCELLARLPELTRTCNLSKDLLSVRQASGEIPQFSLLSELLKGDIIVQSAE